MNLKNLTFNEAVQKYGDRMYNGIEIDESTKASLLEYFGYMNISIHDPNRWISLWRRNLRMYINVYNQELDMWKEYRTEEWFYDKIKLNDKKHTETTSLTENVKRQIERDLNRTFGEIYRSIVEGNSSGDNSNTINRTNSQDTNNENHEISNGKDRSFSFNYPESNYTGGVIPYDLNNNPVVEFISQQADSLNRKNTDQDGSTHLTGKDDSTEKGNYTNNTNGTEDRNTDQNSNETEDTGSNEDRTNTVTNEYTDHYEYDGSNIIDLANKMINLIPQSNFFLELVKHLEQLFCHVFSEDEIMFEYYGGYYG